MRPQTVDLLSSQTLTVLLKAEVMNHSGKHAPVPTFLECWHPIQNGPIFFKKQSNFSVLTFDLLALYYFHGKLGFKCFASHCFCFYLHFAQRPKFFGVLIVNCLL